MAVVLAATALASGIPAFGRARGLPSAGGVLAGSIAAGTTGELIGHGAIAYYRRRAERQSEPAKKPASRPRAARSSGTAGSNRTPRRRKGATATRLREVKR